MTNKLKTLTGAVLAFCLVTPVIAGDHGNHAVGTKLSANEALNEMRMGNERFVKGESRHQKTDPATRKNLVNGQKPHTIILSCSDSRVPPEIIFDKGLGEIFPIRLAGNVISSQGVASIEYAVAHLGAKVLMVMGHESCGAVKAALDTPVGKSAGSYDLDNLVSAIRPHVEANRSIASEDKKLRAPVESNVHGVSCGLMRRSQIIRDAVAAGKLKVVPSVYSIESGKVDFLEFKKDCLPNSR